MAPFWFTLWPHIIQKLLIRSPSYVFLKALYFLPSILSISITCRQFSYMVILTAYVLVFYVGIRVDTCTYYKTMLSLLPIKNIRGQVSTRVPTDRKISRNIKSQMPLPMLFLLITGEFNGTNVIAQWRDAFITYYFFNFCNVWETYSFLLSFYLSKEPNRFIKLRPPCFLVWTGFLSFINYSCKHYSYKLHAPPINKIVNSSLPPHLILFLSECPLLEFPIGISFVWHKLKMTFPAPFQKLKSVE